MAAMGNKNKIWQRFNINSLWLDPSELIYNARIRAHFLRFIVRTFAHRKCVFSEIWFGRGSLSPWHFHWISIRFDMHADKLLLLLFLCSSRWFACLFYFSAFFFSLREKPLSLASSLPQHNKIRSVDRPILGTMTNRKDNFILPNRPKKKQEMCEHRSRLFPSII